jgi:hypothetical protein
MLNPIDRAYHMSEGNKMKIRSKLILLIASMCIFLTATALSQGGANGGGNHGESLQTGQNEMMSGPGDMPVGQDQRKKPNNGPSGSDMPIGQDQQNKPNSVPSGNPSNKPVGAEIEFGPKDVPHDESPLWTYVKPDDEKHDEPSFGLAGPDDNIPPRSIMGQDHPQVPPKKPKKSMMTQKHHKAHKKPLKPLRPLNPEDLPILPPMKSMMDHP